MATDSGEVEASLIGPMNGGGVVREMRTGTGWDAVEQYERAHSGCEAMIRMWMIFLVVEINFAMHLNIIYI